MHVYNSDMQALHTLHVYMDSLHYITLHYITLHYITLHYITLHGMHAYITLHCMYACIYNMCACIHSKHMYLGLRQDASILRVKIT